MVTKLRTSHTYLFLIVLTLFCLLPFAGKAFHIDDPFYIWVARQIQAHPLDFYGFDVNWYQTSASAAIININPPLVSYYIAIAAAIVGWSEMPLHIAFLLPAITAVIGTYFLARELTSFPLIATLIAFLTPVFIVSSTTVMADISMLVFYVWAVFLWVRGIRLNSMINLIFASLLIALSSLSKYFGISLIPLLLVYTLSKGQKKQVLFLLLPVAIICLYEWGTILLYGRGLLLSAVNYITPENRNGWQSHISRLLTGFSFIGGCFISTLLIAPCLWKRVVLIILATLTLLLGLILSQINLPAHPQGASWSYFLQLSLFIIAGAHLITVVGRDLWKKRDPESLLLALWFFGTFYFAVFTNWSVTGRSVLPMAPVAGIVVVRALGEKWKSGEKEWLIIKSWIVGIPLLCSWVISMMVAWADYRLADTARRAAAEISQEYLVKPYPLIFQGHWGFQYYMENKGGMAMDIARLPSSSWIHMVVPGTNTNTNTSIIAQALSYHAKYYSPLSFVSSMNEDVGAGFYSSYFGALPFVFGRIPDETYHIALISLKR